MLRSIQAEQGASEHGTAPATPEEQQTLARWAGWGAVPEVFDDKREDFAWARDELRSLLSDDEYAAAARSTINAHYTDAAIVQAIWAAVADLGFAGGRVIEPGCGSGNFIGFAPPAATMTGVEMEPVTAAIAAALYPAADICCESFADTRAAAGSFDLAIGNVPFADVVPHDPRHNPHKHALHNYFIVKALHLTRPGGLVAVITSRYTMDSRNPAARREIAGLADLVGAVRLPSGAHQKAAGTSVVTDLLILRRREPGREPAPVAWERARVIEMDGNEVEINEYFLDHPHRVLGESSAVHGAYRAGDLAVKATGDTHAALTATLRRITTEAAENRLTWEPAAPSPAPAPAMLSAERSAELDGYLAARDDGTFTKVIDGVQQPHPVPSTQASELRALLGLRDSVRALLDAEAVSIDTTPEMLQMRRQLGLRYDHYAARFGPLNRYKTRPTGRIDPRTGEPQQSRIRPPQGGFRGDPYAPLVYALEEFEPVGQRAAKAAIFSRRVVAPRTPSLGADTPDDALAICVDTYGEVRLSEIARLLGTDEETARAQLGTLVYEIPPDNARDVAGLMEHGAADLSAMTGIQVTGADISGEPRPAPPAPGDPSPGTLVPAAAYLSGNVRQKLAIAEAAAAEDSRFGANAAALRGGLPADLAPAEINARFGAAWIDASYVQQFLREILEDDSLMVEHPGGQVWGVRGGRHSVLATSTWGTERYPAPQLAHTLLEQRKIEVRDEGPNDTYILNPDATLAAQAKAAELAERFSEWAWEDPERAATLARIYNDKFNSIVLRSYDDAQLSLPGLSLHFTPRPHQVAAVARMIHEPAVLLAHEVGAGKTAEMIMGVTELRRLGLIRKPAIIVPNHMLEQFSREWLQLYPQAKVLVAAREDLQRDQRRRFVARVATGDWDGIVISSSAFERIPMSAEHQRAYMDRELEEMRRWIEEAKGGEGITVKRLQRALARAEERLKAKLDSVKDPGVTFEATGIDYFCVDEAHRYKNLRTPSNIADAAIDGSMRATDLDMKVDYLRRRNGRRVVTFATATPIANSITEAHVMQRYLRPDLLEAAGVLPFDSWAATFGKVVSQVELAPEGGSSFRLKSRFAKFVNVPEMLLMWRVFADVKTAEDLHLPVPALVTRPGDGQRAPETVAVEPSDDLTEYVAELGIRAEKCRTRQVRPDEDNMLKVSGDGRRAALDMRLVGLPQNVPGKIEAAAARIALMWQRHRDDQYAGPDGTPYPTRGSLQLVFCDLGTPSEDWNAYDELRDQLTDRGVPRDGIRFVHEARNDTDLARLFAACRSGRVAVLVGSTEKMGVGTNVQDRAVALHHLDAPWRPADVNQRDGRLIRQGNLNSEVEVIRWVTRRSFDGYMWQTLERKARFIAQVMHGSLEAREVDDIGDIALNFAEVKAIATDNPLLLEQAQADEELTRLRRAERAYYQTRNSLDWTVRRSEQTIESLTGFVADLETAIARRRETRGDRFVMVVEDRRYTKRPDAGTHLISILQREMARLGGSSHQFTVTLGELGGFPLQAQLVNALGQISANLRFDDAPGTDLRMTPTDLADAGPTGLVTRLENRLGRMEASKEKALGDIDRAHKEIAHARDGLDKPFAQADQLAAAKERSDRIREALAEKAKETDAARVAEGATVSPPPAPSAPQAGSPALPASSDSAGDHTVPYTHVMYFEDRAAAERCAAELGGLDFLCGIDRSQSDPSLWLLQAAREVPVADLIERHDMVEAIVKRHGGDYDAGESGWISERTGQPIRSADPPPHGGPPPGMPDPEAPSLAPPSPHTGGGQALPAISGEDADASQPRPESATRPDDPPPGPPDTPADQEGGNGGEVPAAAAPAPRRPGRGDDSPQPTLPDPPGWLAAHPLAEQLETIRQAALTDSLLAATSRNNSPSDLATSLSPWLDTAIANAVVGADPAEPVSDPQLRLARAFFDDPIFAADLAQTLTVQVLAAHKPGTAADQSDDQPAASVIDTATERWRRAIESARQDRHGCGHLPGVCKQCAVPAGDEPTLRRAAEVDAHLSRLGLPREHRSIIAAPDGTGYAVVWRGGDGPDPWLPWLLVIPRGDGAACRVTRGDRLFEDLGPASSGALASAFRYALYPGAGPRVPALPRPPGAAQGEPKTDNHPPTPPDAASPAAAEPPPGQPTTPPPGPGESQRPDPLPAAKAAPAPGAGAAGLIIEHHARGTLVHGTSKDDLEVREFLRKRGFKWSSRLNAWYLGRQWTYSTRDRHVRGLRADLDAVGHTYQVDDQAASTLQAAPTEPIQPGEPYDTARQALADYRQLNHLYWELRETSTGKRLLVYAMQGTRPDAAALKGAVHAALDPRKELAGPPGEVTARFTALAHAAQALTRNLTDDRYRAPQFMAALCRFSEAAERTTGRLTSTAQDPALWVRVIAAPQAAPATPSAAERPMPPPPSQLQPTLAPDTAASELQPVPSPGATAGTLQFRTARGVAAGELQPVPTPANPPESAPPSLAFPPGPAEQLAETAASHGLTVMPLQGTGPTQTLQVVDAGRAVLLYSAAAGAAAGALRVQDADVPAYLTAYRAHPHLPPPALLDLLQHEGTALPSLSAARELARNHDLEVRIVRAAGTAYITLCEPAAPAPPVLSYTPGAASAFHGPCEIPAGAVPGYLAAYRHSVDQGVFTREHRAADWPRRVAQLTPHVVEGSGHHIPEVARNLQAAALAQAGETRFLDRAELAAPPLTLTAERQAQITEAITDNAAGYHRAGGDPARYIAEGHIDGSDREQDWIRTYIKAHPQVIQADPVPLSAQQQRHAAAAAAQTAEADRISRVAYAAFTSGQPDEALSLLDEAELADPIRGDLWERRRAHVRQAGHTPAQQPGVAGRGSGQPGPELEAGQ